MIPREDEANHAFLQFRGHDLGIEEIPNALIHLYRAQVGRADMWRGRLDSSTNWAVVTTAAALTVTFSEHQGSDMLIPLCTMLVTLFLFIESRRYRYFELWASRVHLLEEAYFARLLSPTMSVEPDWSQKLAESLRNPRFTITLAEALGRRYRRVYIWIYLVLGLSWLVHICVHPVPAGSLQEILDRPTLGYVPASTMLVIGCLYNGTLLAIGLITHRLREAHGEVLSLKDFDQPEEPPEAT